MQTRDVEAASDRRRGELSPPNTIYIAFFLPTYLVTPHAITTPPSPHVPSKIRASQICPKEVTRESPQAASFETPLKPP